MLAKTDLHSALLHRLPSPGCSVQQRRPGVFESFRTGPPNYMSAQLVLSEFVACRAMVSPGENFNLTSQLQASKLKRKNQ